MGILGQGVGRRKPLNLGGKWKIPRRKSKLFLGRFSTMDPLPEGGSSWLLSATLSAGETLSSHQTWPPAVLSYTHCLGTHQLPHLWLHSWGWTLGLALWSSDLLHQVKIAVQVPASKDLVFVLTVPSLEAIPPFWPKAEHHIPVWRACRRGLWPVSH